MAARGRLPVFGPDADQYVRLDQVGIPIESHALAPPLTYLLDGALIRLLPLPPVAAARLGSLLAALAAVALSCALVQVVFDSRQATRSLALATAALVAAVPEISFLAATVNSDVVTDPTRTLLLRANSTTNALTVTPSSLIDFGGVDVQGAPVSKTITITSSGMLSLSNFKRSDESNPYFEFEMVLPGDMMLPPEIAGMLAHRKRSAAVKAASWRADAGEGRQWDEVAAARDSRDATLRLQQCRPAA